jgi:hypothetical protein
MYMQNKIDTLIDRFYKGETNSQEEEFLLSYFAHNQDFPQDDADRNLFQALSAAKATLPEGLEQKLSFMIDSWEAQEKGEKKQVSRRHTIEFRRRIIGIAASVLLIIGVGFWYQYQQGGVQSGLEDTYTNPHDSQEAVLEALQLFSQNFSKGTGVFEKADQKVDQTMKIVDQLLTEKGAATHPATHTK